MKILKFKDPALVSWLTNLNSKEISEQEIRHVVLGKTLKQERDKMGTKWVGL